MLISASVTRHDHHGAANHGEITFGAMQATLNLGYSPSMVFFTWAGFDEMDEVTGDGHAELLDDGPIEITPQWRRGNPQSQAGYFFNSLLACKLAVIMHAMLRTGELFDPHGGTPAAT